MQSRVIVAFCVDNLGPAAAELLEDRVRPRRRLDRGSSDADPDLCCRIVQAAVVAPDDGNRQRHLANLTSAPRSRQPKVGLDGRRLAGLGGPAAWIVVARELQKHAVQGLAGLSVERGEQLVLQAIDDRP